MSAVCDQEATNNSKCLKRRTGTGAAIGRFVRQPHYAHTHAHSHAHAQHAHTRTRAHTRDPEVVTVCGRDCGGPERYTAMCIALQTRATDDATICVKQPKFDISISSAGAPSTGRRWCSASLETESCRARAAWLRADECMSVVAAERAETHTPSASYGDGVLQ